MSPVTYREIHQSFNNWARSDRLKALFNKRKRVSDTSDTSYSGGVVRSHLKQVLILRLATYLVNQDDLLFVRNCFRLREFVEAPTSLKNERVILNEILDTDFDVDPQHL